MYVKLGGRNSSDTPFHVKENNWEQLCQCRLRKIVLVSLGNNYASLAWKKLYQCHLGAIMPTSLVNNCASLTREKL